jgi:hypothetical protein
MKRFLPRLGAMVSPVFGGIAGTCLLGAVAQAGTIAETDRTTVLTVLGGSALVEDFTSGAHFPITTGVLNSETNLPGIGITPGTILPGVTYSTPIGSGFFFNIDAGGGFPGGFLDTITGNALTVQFTTAQTAFGFDTNALMGSSFNITIDFSGGASFFDTLSIPNTFSLTGFGFISSADDITSAVIVNPNNQVFGFAIDNFTYAFSPVPEPASLALLGIALAGFSAIRRRRKTA